MSIFGDNVLIYDTTLLSIIDDFSFFSFLFSSYIHLHPQPLFILDYSMLVASDPNERNGSIALKMLQQSYSVSQCPNMTKFYMRMKPRFVHHSIAFFTPVKSKRGILLRFFISMPCLESNARVAEIIRFDLQ